MNNKKEMDIDKLIEERMKEFETKHIPKIKTKFGNTYISFEIIDYITEKSILKLRTLFDLMGIEYCVSVSYGESFYFLIKGEDEQRAEYIQKFIDNGYKLVY